MKMGLRGKTALALGACIATVLALAWVAGWRAERAIEENLGSAYARNVTRYDKQRILTLVQRELALSQRFADSEVTRRWLLDESDPAKRSLFFAEAEGYRRAFADHSYFVISRADRGYYFNDDHSQFSDRPRYFVKERDSADAWFFATMRKTKGFNINVDPDAKLKLTKIWFNVVVKNGSRNIGLAGTGLDLTTFLKRFITAGEAGVTPMCLDRNGAIEAYPDRRLIDYSSINDKGTHHSTIYPLLTGPNDGAVVRTAFQRAERNPEQIQSFWADLGGRRELFTASFIPELGWFVVSAVDLRAARVFDTQLWLPPLLIRMTMLALLVLGIVVATNRIVLAPLLKLTDAVRSMTAGDYAVELPSASNDELGELTRAFGAMAAKVRSHTEELETKVSLRTRELVDANKRMAAANQKIDDSIRYASLIQNAILPNEDLARSLGDRYFVLWRPRDVVGGDFFVFRAEERGCLIGVVDCAGHGVPGAFMTMMAHTIVNMAMDTIGLSDPAALLREMDARIRAGLPSLPGYSQVATQMDAGLAYVNFERKAITYSGAKTSLFWCDGDGVARIEGDRSAIGSQRSPAFTNKTSSLDPRTTVYLTTDGFLDQSGGPKGYSFGRRRFEDLIRRHSGRPLDEQRTAFAEELDAYQGDRSQRDDITVLSFRFASSEEPS